MKRITVRALLRGHWPCTEAMLRSEGALVVTRDGKPVAQLLPIRRSAPRWRRFDAERHAKWQERVNRGKTVRWVQEFLLRERAGSAP